eukprot:4861522-Prymnesium_polylepis.1
MGASSAAVRRSEMRSDTCEESCRREAEESALEARLTVQSFAAQCDACRAAAMSSAVVVGGTVTSTEDSWKRSTRTVTFSPCGAAALDRLDESCAVVTVVRPALALADSSSDVCVAYESGGYCGGVSGGGARGGEGGGGEGGCG